MRDPVKELVDLMAVHNFFISTVEMTLGHSVPLAPEVVHPDSSEEAIGETLSAMRRWLNLLDLAISPAMIRDSLLQDSVAEINEALLRYYVGKGVAEGQDRDKADLVITQLCRHPGDGLAGSLHIPEHAGYGAIAGAALEFEAQLYRMLADVHMAPLQEHHVQLLREFEFLHEEVEEFRDFQQILTSGIIGRVRTIKDRFGVSFYHPDVLATVAVYNVLFGNKFDLLFRKATEDIRKFAERMEQEGASLMSRVEGNVTVQNLKEIEGSAILRAEYRTAKEDLNRVATAQRAVDHRRGSVRAPGAGSTAAAAAPAKRAHSTAAAAAAALEAHPQEHVIAGNPMEESKLKTVTEQIRTFVRSCEAKATTIVPMPKGAITLTLAEAEAFRADYGNEKSFRADLAEVICDVISMDARLTSELEEFRVKERSAYLWKPHADSLAYMLSQVAELQHRARAVLEVAQQRGLTEKVNAVNGALQKLRREVQSATQALRTMQPGRHH